MLKGYLNIDYPEIDLNKFPYRYKNDSAEEILLDNVLEHLDEPYKVICECWRILELGGVLDITVPHLNTDFGKNPLHKQYFHENWFKSFDENSKCHTVFGNIDNPNIKHNAHFLVALKLERDRLFRKRRIHVWMTKVK